MCFTTGTPLILDSDSSNPELIADVDGFCPDFVDLKHLFTVHFSPHFIREQANNLFGPCIDYFSCGRVCESAINAKSDPTGLFAKLDAVRLLGRGYRIIENVNVLIGGIDHPNLVFVGCQSDTVARASMSLDGSRLESSDFDAMKFLSGRKVANLEAK